MKFELFPFQQKAQHKLRMFATLAQEYYRRTAVPQVVSFTAPTGAGKTIMIAAFVESVYLGDEIYPAQPDAIFVWLSDSPELNKQSLDKFYFNADGVNHEQLVEIADESFDRQFLEDGKIYFLNTQKISKSSNLTRHSDLRQFTIWETLQNTLRDKSDKLYFIIDEAHRGMKGREAGKATTIMQKFIKGSTSDGISPVPLVIGMSATPERFNALVAGTTSTIHQVVVTTEEVRISGLLKEQIIVVHPDDTERTYVSKDMAMLDAAADEWKSKCEHWQQYCREQHRKLFNPILVIQVTNGTGNKISETDLDECLKRISNRTGFNFDVGEVVHTFGQTTSDLTINNLRVLYDEPSHISDNDKIKVVFFKENLSTGWDCPRAETMMSFRRAADATYIAQLLGRMIRTPMKSRIDVDETLNDVKLYLPNFNSNTVQNVVDEFKKAEGGVIPTDITSESRGEGSFDTWTVNPSNASNSVSTRTEAHAETSQTRISTPTAPSNSPAQPDSSNFSIATETKTSPSSVVPPESLDSADTFDRAEVVKSINQMGLLTYDVRSVRINDYLKSLLKIAHFLTRNGIYPEAFGKVTTEIVHFIDAYITKLKESGKYESFKLQAKQFKLSAQIFDVFGKNVESHVEQDLFVTTDSDIERQFMQAEMKLKSEGISNAYLRTFCSDYTLLTDYKINVILFVANNDCLNRLDKFAQTRFHALNDEYRRKIAKCPNRIKTEYDRIVSDSDIISEHNFTLPETISVLHDSSGEEYADHLFVDKNSGSARIKLNGWEKAVLREEQHRSDFICWLRNPPRPAWAMCIPYHKENGEIHTMFPDFLIIRREGNEYVVDILEPHDPERRDNIGKAKGLAEYAKQNTGIGRIQLIREVRQNDRVYFRRLNLSEGAIREKVRRVSSNNELDNIFEEYGRSEDYELHLDSSR